MIIIGTTGQPSSGKDTVADRLVFRGFAHISTSNLIREEMGMLGIPTDRPHMSEFANKARQERGPGYLAEQAIQKVVGDTVISGLRNVSEVEVLRQRFGKDFILVAIEAPLETRYGWAQARQRISDSISFEQFKAEEDAERNGNADAHQVDVVMALADTVIINDGTLEQLLEKVDAIVETSR